MNMLKKAVKRVSLCRRLQGRQNSRSSRDSVLLPLLPLSLQCSSQVSVLSSCPLVPGACPGKKKKTQGRQVGQRILLFKEDLTRGFVY